MEQLIWLGSVVRHLIKILYAQAFELAKTLNRYPISACTNISNWWV